MKKGTLLVVFVLIFVLAIPSSAMETRKVSVTSELIFNGTEAACNVSVMETGKIIDVTMELWCGSTLVDSWSDEGTSRVTVEGSCRVTKGKTYTLKTYGTVDGARFTGAPVSKTC